MANPRNGLTNHLRDALRAAAPALLQVHAVMKALTKAGVEAEEKNVRSLLSQRHVAGEFLCARVDNLAAFGMNPDFVSRHGKVPAASDAGVDPEETRVMSTSFTGSLGMRCATPAAVPVETLRQAIERVLADTEASMAGLLLEMGDDWTPRQLLSAVTDGVFEGWLRSFEVGPGKSVYSLARAAADKPVEMCAVPVNAAPFVPRAPRAPLDLRDRVEAIASDIEDAIGAACDACLAHELIKALTVANGATQRALRQLAA